MTIWRRITPIGGEPEHMVEASKRGFLHFLRLLILLIFIITYAERERERVCVWLFLKAILNSLPWMLWPADRSFDSTRVSFLLFSIAFQCSFHYIVVLRSKINFAWIQPHFLAASLYRIILTRCSWQDTLILYTDQRWNQVKNTECRLSPAWHDVKGISVVF